MLSSQKTFSLLFLVFDRVEFGHSSTHTESGTTLHQRRTINCLQFTDLLVTHTESDRITGQLTQKVIASLVNSNRK